MKTTIQRTITKSVIMMMSMAFLTGCSKDDDINPEPVVTSCEIVEVSGKISEPTVWKAGHVYVINGSDLRVESILTIEPGVIVKVKNARISIYENGKVNAEGTADKRITFTSLADDRYCGDTNGDAMATKPEKGDWVSLTLQGTIGSVFKYVDIFYAGQTSGGTNRGVDIGWSQSVSFTFDHCRIAHTMNGSRHDSQAFHGSTSMVDANVSKFTNNAIYDNGKPIYFNAFYTLDPSNIFHDPENPSITNTNNGIYLYGSVMNKTVDWNNTEVPYVVDQYLQVYNSATININPNVIVKFMRQSAGFSRSAPQNIILSPTAILTSYKDDTHGGDTNGDSKATSSVKGDWIGLRNTYLGNPYWEKGPNIKYSAN